MLVFAFLPTLAALPRWVAFEATSTLNLHDPVVLAFLPVRGALLLLSALEEGLVPGILAGSYGRAACAARRLQPAAASLSCAHASWRSPEHTLTHPPAMHCNRDMGRQNSHCRTDGSNEIE